jgi:hypothetical protein
MPVGHRLDPAARLVLITYADPVTVKDWTDALLAVIADQAYEPGFNFLVDRRNASPPAPDFADAVATFVRRHRAEIGNAKVAILVSDVAAFGMARMQEMLNEAAELETRAFRAEHDAREWLGLLP